MKALIGAGSLLLTWVGSAASAGHDVSPSELTKVCREEVWRVHMPSTHGPKGEWMPSSEKRTVLICDKQFFAQIQEQASRASGREKK